MTLNFSNDKKPSPAVYPEQYLKQIRALTIWGFVEKLLEMFFIQKTRYPVETAEFFSMLEELTHGNFYNT